MKYSELFIGQSASLSKRFSYEDVKLFSELSLDKNPVHVNESYANKSPFQGLIVHGFLTSSLFSGVIGSILPGDGSIYLNQTMSFRKPVYHDELITAKCTIIDKREDKPILTLETVCINEKGEIVITGSAIIKYIEE